MSHLLSYQLVYLITCLMTCILTVQTQDNIFTITPNQSVCIGESVVLTCYLFPPVGTDYTDFARLSFNQSASLEVSAINTNFGSIGYTATVSIPIMGASARIQLTIGSFQVSDSNTLFGCHAQFNNNASFTEAIESVSASLAAPPSTPTVSSLSTNCTKKLISWTAPASDRDIERYYVYRNSTLLAVTTDTLYTDRDQLLVNTLYQYSVIANSCAGNSTEGIGNSFIKGSELSESPPLFISYTRSDSMLLVDWTLKPNPGSPSILLQYSLSLEYSHSNDSTTYTFSDTTQFSLLSSADTTLSLPITAHNFSSEDGLETNITALLSITQQCGSSFSGVELRAEYNSANPPTRPPTTTAPVTTSATTPGMSTTTTLAPKPATSSSILLILVILIILISLLFLSIILVMGICMFAMYRKIKQLQSLPKQTPHPYEYIDLNMVSPDTAVIPSVPKDSAYYTPMQSVGTQGNSNVVPPVYANLK